MPTSLGLGRYFQRLQWSDSFLRRGGTRGTQGYEIGDKGAGFLWRKVPPVSRHIATSLNHLSYELRPSQTRADTAEVRSTLAPEPSDRVAIAAL